MWTIRIFKSKYFNENIKLNVNDILKKTPDDIIYCIENEELTPKIKYLFEIKECKIKDCDINWKQNYEKIIEMKKNDINVINDLCITKDIQSISSDFFFSNKISNTSIYSYKIGSIDELKYKNSNLTFIEISEEQKKELLNIFHINENESLYVFIYDTPSNESRTATSDYNYILLLEKGID